MRRFVEWAALVLVTINALFLVGIIGTLAMRWATWTAPVVLPIQQLNLGPAMHLPLAGMNGASFPPEQACLRLNGFLMEMARALGGGVPVSASEIRTVVDSGHCSIDDPDVRAIIVRFREAYEHADLDPLSPFSVVD